MKQLLQTLFFFLLVTQICFAQLGLSRSESKSEYPSTKFSDFSFNVDSLITTTMANYHIPGLSACIVRDSEIIWSGAYGWANIQGGKLVTDTTLFSIASLSKPFVGTAIMQLWENGLFELDEDINNYLPFQVRNPNHPNIPITFRMLLTHTSSIVDNWSKIPPNYQGGDSPIPLDSFLINYLRPGGIFFNNANYSTSAPLTSWIYSNVGATLIAYLVENISNKSFEQYCQDSIFIPLGMNESSWFLSNLNANNIAIPYYYSGGSYNPYGNYGSVTYPAGQLRTSAKQYARHLIAFMQKGQIDGVRILNNTTVELMTTIQFPNIRYDQALIWFIYPWTVPGFGTHNFCGHNGSNLGVRTGMDFTLETNFHTGVIVLTNGESDEGRNIIWDALYSYSITIPTDVEDTELSLNDFSLLQNFPNPFNPSTKISWQSPVSSWQTLKVFDVLGNEVATLVNEEKEAGSYEVEFNAEKLSSGVYFYQLLVSALQSKDGKAGSFVETKKMLLLR